MTATELIIAEQISEAKRQVAGYQAAYDAAVRDGELDRARDIDMELEQWRGQVEHLEYVDDHSEAAISKKKLENILPPCKRPEECSIQDLPIEIHRLVGAGWTRDAISFAIVSYYGVLSNDI